MGESEGTLIKRSREMGGPLPDRIANAPELWLGLDFFYNAFWSLCSERSSGMGAGPIPWHAMMQYADRHKLDEDMTEDLEFLIGKMDCTYLKHMEKKSEAKKEFDRSVAERKPLKAKLSGRM